MNVPHCNAETQDARRHRLFYLRDSVFICGCLLYVFNRWGLQPQSGFLRNHFADLLLMPCALPVLMQIQHWIGLRQPNQWPGFREIVVYLFLWSALFEWVGPALVEHATGDPLDVAAYAAGAALCSVRWRCGAP